MFILVGGGGGHEILSHLQVSVYISVRGGHETLSHLQVSVYISGGGDMKHYLTYK